MLEFWYSCFDYQWAFWQYLLFGFTVIELLESLRCDSVVSTDPSLFSCIVFLLKFMARYVFRIRRMGVNGMIHDLWWSVEFLTRCFFMFFWQLHTNVCEGEGRLSQSRWHKIKIHCCVSPFSKEFWIRKYLHRRKGSGQIVRGIR